ncbi:MAG: PadR family transcriptional regulator [Candidatus Lokiarchaeota archaeon]|nr:PadR family transcriptional regulator [Candidatus Lokiarchaeota archaeon]
MTNEKNRFCKSPDCCNMKGMLQFLIMFILSKEPMNGSQIADEIGRRRGDKPTPGTIYPALKELSKKHIINSTEEGKQKIYSLTDLGKEGLVECKAWFKQVFGDILQ